MDAGLLALGDVVEGHGYQIPHFALVACIAFRLTQAGSSSLGFDSAQSLRLLGDRGLVATLGARTRLLDAGLRSVCMVLTLRHR